MAESNESNHPSAVVNLLRPPRNRCGIAPAIILPDFDFAIHLKYFLDVTELRARASVTVRRSSFQFSLDIVNGELPIGRVVITITRERGRRESAIENHNAGIKDSSR